MRNRITLLKTLLVAVLMGLSFSQQAMATVVKYDLTGKFSGSTTACTMTDGAITTPVAIADELNKNATYSFTFSGDIRAKGDGTGLTFNTANNTFTINGLSGGEEIYVELSPQLNNNSYRDYVLQVKTGQKCVIAGVDVETGSNKTVSTKEGSYVPIYMKDDATSLTVTATQYVILKSVTIMTPNRKYTRNVTYGDANTWTDEDISSEEWVSSSGFVVDVPASSEDLDSHYGLGYTQSSDPGKSLLTQKVFSLATEGGKVKYDLTWYVGGAPGVNSGYTSYNHYYLQFGNYIRVSWNQSSKYSFYATTDGTCTTTTENQLYSRNSTSTPVSIPVQIIINRATNTVERFMFNGTDYTSKVAGVISDTFDKIVMGYQRNTSGNTYKAPTYISSIKVTEYEQPDFEYTVKYLCEETVVKEQVIRTGKAGASIVLTDEDKAACFNSGNTMKYFYVSDDAEGKTITENNATVVTLTFREAETWTAILKSDTDDEIGRTTGFEGETVYIPYPRFSLRAGTLYEAAYQATGNRYSKGINLSTDNKEAAISYSATGTTNVVFYVEAEDIDGIKQVNNNNLASRGSGCKGGATQGETKTFTTLSAGKYKLSAYTGGKKDQTFLFYAGDTQIGSFTSADYLSSATTDEFTITEDTDIKLKGGWQTSTAANAYAVDLIYIQRVAEAVTVSDAGFATYVSSKDLDYTDTGIKAYTAQVTGGNVVLTQINKVPANTPVLLYKEGGATENIPVTTETDEVGTNELVAGTGAAVATTDGDYTNYILNNNASGIGFYRANGQTVATNRAYLHTLTANTTAARMAIIFADDDNITTSIKAIDNGQLIIDNYYDLQGRRVAEPAKGLYIMNGKKVVIK